MTGAVQVSDRQKACNGLSISLTICQEITLKQVLDYLMTKCKNQEDSRWHALTAMGPITHSKLLCTSLVCKIPVISSMYQLIMDMTNQPDIQMSLV